jgi:hypothetical protein
MSNYYEGNQGCQGCLQKGQYTDLKNMTNFECDNYCSCRFQNGRSTKDKMYYDWFVLNKPMNIPKGGDVVLKPPQNNVCGK